MTERFINNSIFSFDFNCGKFAWFDKLTVNDYSFFTIVWNLSLLVVPFLIAVLMKKILKRNYSNKLWHKVSLVGLFLLWTFFVPNAAYIITDIRHLLDYCPSDSPFRVCEDNAWMIIFFFSYAVVGWVSFVYLLRQMRGIILKIFGGIADKFFILGIIPLVALGVLLGLLNRWNSWEVFIYPLGLLKNIFQYFSDYVYFFDWFVFVLFFYVLYFVGEKIFKEF